jgi:hypothetical protein
MAIGAWNDGLIGLSLGLFTIWKEPGYSYSIQSGRLGGIDMNWYTQEGTIEIYPHGAAMFTLG